MYGQAPAIHIPYLASDSRVEAMGRSLRVRKECIHMLKYHLEQAQRRIKQQADKSRVDRVFEVGDLVMLSYSPVNSRQWL